MSSAPSTERPLNVTSTDNPACSHAHHHLSGGRAHFHNYTKSLARPLSFFHPTHSEFVLCPTSLEASAPPSKWSSRASRKRVYPRNAVHASRHPDEVDILLARASQRSSSSLVTLKQRFRHPHVQLKLHVSWDVSFWVAVIFVLGSIAWIVNGFYFFLPLLSEANDHTTAAFWWAFAGGTLFELGSYLMFVESLNTGHEQLFGPSFWGLMPLQHHKHPPWEKGNSEETLHSAPSFRWIGFGSLRDIGFAASFIQLIAATVFWISTITGLPHVIPNLTVDPDIAIADVFFWTPQVVGGIGFILASILLMLEVQEKWWKPNLSSLGWHIGFWNLVGAVGFTVCGALGYGGLVSSKVGYESVLSTFWGSWAFLIGSVLQLWETLFRQEEWGKDRQDS